MGAADLVVRDGDRPLALLEVKAAATQHGNQYSRYDEWARAQAAPVACHLVTLEAEPEGAPEGWTTETTLPALLRSWQGSSHPQAGWLAASAAHVLEWWISQTDGKIGRATSPFVADLVTRQVAKELANIEGLSYAGLDAKATRTNGGTAMILAWLPFPSEPEDPTVSLCVDLRSMSRAHPQIPWVLRLGVQVDAVDPRTSGQVRAAAHDLAMAMRAALTFSALNESFRRAGQDELVAAIRLRHNTHDGLRKNTNDSSLIAWRKGVFTTSQNYQHPVFYNDFFQDGSLRLSGIIEVDVMEIDRQQLLQLIIRTLDFMNQYASRNCKTCMLWQNSE